MLSLFCLLFFGLILENLGMVSFALCFSALISLGGLYQNFYFSSDIIFSSSTLSSLLIFLTCFLCFLSLLSTPEEMNSKMYLCCLSSLGLVLFMAFSSSNLILFYIFFEASLIPTLILIIGWGYQPERLQAGSYMMLYTVGASLPLLVAILWFCNKSGSMDISSLHLIENHTQGLVSFVIYGAFLVKLPMYSFHLWLPKAHVEAPLAGSMILAGILLKLGGFGLIQMNYCFNMVINNFTLFLVCLSMWGGLLATLTCLRQVDMKALVAYSSVGHMSIVSVGVILDQSWGVISALVMMLAHGFSSSAMFCLAYFSYKKSHTRSIPYMSGILQMYPILSLFWFLFCCINMSCPPTLNLFSELSIIPVLWSFNILLVVVMGFMIFFSAGYNMYLYIVLNHGMSSPYMLMSVSMKPYMMLSLLGHLLPLLLIMKCSVFNFF